MAAPPLKMQRTCSQCGNNGHNARTCTEQQTSSNNISNTNNNNNNNGFMLFGVRLNPKDMRISPSSPCSSPSSSSTSFRKSMSMNNLSQYEHLHQQPHDSHSGDLGGSGYASDDALHASGSRSRERKRGVPWTEDEHRSFLRGLGQVGKGDWRGISRNFVKTRTPTQVASHAQKYFQRLTNPNRRRRRSSLFDITTDTLTRSSSDSQLQNLAAFSQANPTTHQTTLAPLPYPPTLLPVSTKHVPPIPVPPSSKMANLNLNQSPSSSPSSSTSTSSTREREFEPFLSLKLPQQPSDEGSSRRPSTFGGFNGTGDSIISVA